MTFQWTAGIEGSENCAVAIQVSSIPLHYFPHYCTFFYTGLTLRSLDYALTTREQFTFNHQVLSSFCIYFEGMKACVNTKPPNC